MAPELPDQHDPHTEPGLWVLKAQKGPWVGQWHPLRIGENLLTLSGILAPSATGGPEPGCVSIHARAEGTLDITLMERGHLEGVWLNGWKLNGTSPARPGDVLRLGHHEFCVLYLPPADLAQEATHQATIKRPGAS
jgi:hypothetical protein